MHLFDWVSQPSAWIALLTLLVLEIVLGIDNIIFISILSGKLPRDQQAKARQLGLLLALVSRIALLLSINWVKNATAPVFTIPLSFLPAEGQAFSWRDIILGGGGLFLIWKSVKEIHGKLEGEEGHVKQAEQLEGDVGLGPCLRHRIGAVMPGPHERLAAEGIAARPAEGVPVADRKAQVILEPAAMDEAILVVPAEGGRLSGILAGEGDRHACLEEFG